MSTLSSEERAQIRKLHRSDEALRPGCCYCDDHWPCQHVRVVEYIEAVEAERDALRKWKEDATRFCPGEFPCEASTAAAYLERDFAALRAAADGACVVLIGLEQRRELPAAVTEEIARQIERLTDALADTP